MILNDIEVENRLNSLDNLSNRLKGFGSKKDQNSLPISNLSRFESKGQSVIEIPSLPPGIDNLVDDLTTKIKTAKINESALDVLDISLDQLKQRLCEVESPRDLSRIASDMGKILSANKPAEKNETNQNQVIIYKPVMVNENHYETISVNE